MKAVAARKVPPYRGERYWETEKPQEVRTDRIALAYYPKAGKFQVSLLFTPILFSG